MKHMDRSQNGGIYYTNYKTGSYIIFYCYLYLVLILINSMLFPQKYHHQCYVHKSQFWYNTRCSIWYLGTFIIYASKAILEWVQSHQPMCENKQQFHHHHWQARRISYPVDHQFRPYRRPPKNYLSRQLQDLDAVTMTTTNSEKEPIQESEAQRDTDKKIGVENRCSAFIFHNINDFHGPVRKVNRSIKIFRGERNMIFHQEMIIWKWCNNEGILHGFIIPNSYYVPAGKLRLLSPQHWAKLQSVNNAA